VSVIKKLIQVSSKGPVFYKMNKICDSYFLSAIVKNIKEFRVENHRKFSAKIFWKAIILKTETILFMCISDILRKDVLINYIYINQFISQKTQSHSIIGISRLILYREIIGVIEKEARKTSICCVAQCSVMQHSSRWSLSLLTSFK
jgi:hypothetical protein